MEKPQDRNMNHNVKPLGEKTSTSLKTSTKVEELIFVGLK